MALPQAAQAGPSGDATRRTPPPPGTADPQPTGAATSGPVSTSRFPGADGDTALAAAAATQAAAGPHASLVHVSLPPVHTADTAAAAAGPSTQPAVTAKQVADEVMAAMRKHISAQYNKLSAVEAHADAEAERAAQREEEAATKAEAAAKSLDTLLQRANTHTVAIERMRTDISALRADLLEQRRALRDLQAAVQQPVALELSRRTSFNQLPLNPPPPPINRGNPIPNHANPRS